MMQSSKNDDIGPKERQIQFFPAALRQFAIRHLNLEARPGKPYHLPTLASLIMDAS